MKILVIFTGGTIGSSSKDGYISPDETKKYRILEQYKQLTGSGQLFDTLEPYTTLSENLEGTHLTKLMKCVKDNLGKYDGIIITHGTDTLQYTAAALTYAFGMDTVPIVLVSSNRIIEDDSANGIANFRGAVEFINGGYGRGVYVSYRNDSDVSVKLSDGAIGDICTIHVGNQLMSHIMYDEAVYSLNYNYYGRFENHNFIKNDEFNMEPIEEMGVRNMEEESPIMIITPYVGMKNVNIPEHIKTVLFTTYHSGTINTDSQDIIRFAAEAAKRNVKLRLVGLEPSENAPSGYYESVGAYEKLGIKVMPKLPYIAAYMKLWMEECDELQ